MSIDESMADSMAEICKILTRIDKSIKLIAAGDLD